ncbi:MAG: 2,3-bisphosphoglycerate-independent phosphoglycerate mutase [Oscillospiraceae bacterium]|nr:2,3-bisphosphoglycerate-independent phosphoglycerate mutase [Oscillospiraceae bacterium]
MNNARKLIKTQNFGGFNGISGPLVCIVMDGVGLAPDGEGNAVSRAYKPTLDYLFKNYPWRKLKAHGTAVGLPSDEDMGNSEVGHNAMGAGQVFAQGAMLVTQSIESGAMFQSDTWIELRDNCRTNNSTLHFIGLFSDGNVHSHIDHLEAMIRHAKSEGIKKVRVHILLDGRDVGETSALLYVDRFEKFLSGINSTGFDAKIASGGGRMNITMDRYGANWKMVEKGWHTHVLGEGRQFKSATEAIETLRTETHAIDQDLGAFVIANISDIDEIGEPVGKINDGDSVIFFNFRGDRAIEISTAFDAGDEFDKFDRIRKPNVVYAGMLEYDGDLHIPKKYLVNPPEITGTLGEYLANEKITQLAVSETQKFGHVTYFWNGNRSGKFDEETETYIEVKSDIVPFEQRPWMKAAEITDVLAEDIISGKYKFIRANFPNGDMVGHTGNLQATIIAVETVDLMLDRIIKAVRQAKGVLIITADHGNADEMYEIDKKTGLPSKDSDGHYKAKTSHTLDPVPCIFLDDFYSDKYAVEEGDFKLSNLAATFVNLLGYDAPDIWDKSMIIGK